MAADSGQGSVMQGEGRRATAETGGMNRPLVNELHCTYTFPLRGAVMATTRKNRHIRTMLGCPLSIVVNAGKADASTERRIPKSAIIVV